MLDEYINDFVEIAPENHTVAYVQASILRKVSNAKMQHVTVDKKWIFGMFAYGYECYINNKAIKVIRQPQWEGVIKSYTSAMQERYATKTDDVNAG